MTDLEKIEADETREFTAEGKLAEVGIEFTAEGAKSAPYSRELKNGDGRFDEGLLAFLPFGHNISILQHPLDRFDVHSVLLSFSIFFCPFVLSSFHILPGRTGSPEMLLFHFMNELLFLYGSEYFIARHIEILDAIDLKSNVLRCRCWGEVFDRSRHSQGKTQKYRESRTSSTKKKIDTLTIYQVPTVFQNYP